jgi:thiamine-phosphate pyrophosphorylase
MFTDLARLPDPRPAAAQLPIGRAGIVFRHDAVADRATLALDLVRVCKARRLVMVVAGDARLTARFHIGTHLRGGRWPSVLRPPGIVTSSAHSVAELRRAARAGADLVFLSPAFPTSSHPGAPGLRPVRWLAVARHAPPGRMAVGALGGVTGANILRLSPRCRAVGAITALAP